MSGHIYVAEHQGSHLVKLTGDMRLSLCTTIDDYLEKVVSKEVFSSLIVDLSEAQCLDSTTLGLLAKFSIKLRKLFGFIPLIISPNPNITRILDSMGFRQIFTIVDKPIETEEDLRELAAVSANEADVKDKVLEAHRVLMGMNEQNRVEFKDLVYSLSKI